MNIIDKLLYAGSGSFATLAVLALAQGNEKGVATCLVAAFGAWRLASWQWKKD